MPRTFPAPWRRPLAATVTVVLALLLAGALIGALGEADHKAASTDGLPSGYQSTKVAELEDRLPDSKGSIAVVLFTADSGKISAADRQMLDQGFARLASSGAQGGPPAQLEWSQDGTAGIGVVPVDATGATQVADAVKELRSETSDAAPDGVTAQVTGPAAIQADLASVFDGANTTLLLTTALVVAVLLILTYRSPVLWLVPLVVVGVADRLAAVLATHGLKLANVPWDESTSRAAPGCPRQL